MVRIALIGCGTMGRTHAGGYLKLEDAKVVAFCDINVQRAEPLAAKHGSRVFPDFDSLMAYGEFDVLDVCLPTYLHRQYAVAAMRAGKHVFCEKPIALTLADAQEMVATAKECGVKFSVGHVLRFFPAYKNAIAQVEKGRLGVPKLIRTTRNQGFPQWSWENWYQDYSKSGGPIVDLIIHDFDWIVHNFGRVERVFARSFNGKVAGQEHCIALLRLENGAIAHVEGSWAYPQGSTFRMTFEVVGTQAQIAFDSVESSPVVRQTVEDGQHRTAQFSPVRGTLEPYCAELNEFVQAVNHNTPPIVTGEQAIDALRVALAAIESSVTGQPVTL
ncbi:MAG: Gfo/Idh/MocA family oxidoreductase [Angelakisella sp.]